MKRNSSPGIRAFYQRTEKLAVTLSSTWSGRTSSGNSNLGGDNTSISLAIGLDGEITPKISGSISGGWQIREISETDEETGSPFFQADLTWAINRVTSLSLNGSSSFGTLLSSQNTEVYSLGASLRRQVNQRLSISALAGWTDTTLDDPVSPTSDTAYNFGANAAVKVNDWISANATFSWTDQQSGRAAASFDQIRAELVLSFRY